MKKAVIFIKNLRGSAAIPVALSLPLDKKVITTYLSSPMIITKE